MPYQIDDPVVLPGYGVGRIVGTVMKRLAEPEARTYYEVVLGKNTVWVPVDAGAATRLRPLTPRTELVQGRGVLRGRPLPLTPDFRQRRLDLGGVLRAGSFQGLCEMVRDITARGWAKALSDGDIAMLRKAREGLCQEWGAMDGVSTLEAAKEVDALLLEGRETYRA